MKKHVADKIFLTAQVKAPSGVWGFKKKNHEQRNKN